MIYWDFPGIDQLAQVGHDAKRGRCRKSIAWALPRSSLWDLCIIIVGNKPGLAEPKIFPPKFYAQLRERSILSPAEILEEK